MSYIILSVHFRCIYYWIIKKCCPRQEPLTICCEKIFNCPKKYCLWCCNCVSKWTW